MTAPTASIVVINHNYAEFLRAAIDSALGQTIAPAEVVVVDDGSTDGSRDIISGYGDRIQSVLKSAGGHVSAFNAGYAQTSGDICIFLDADDVLYCNCLEAVLAHWRDDAIKLQYRLDTIDRGGVDQHMTFPHFPRDLTPPEIRRQALRFGTYPWTVSSGNAFSRRLLDQLLPIDQTEIYRSPDGYVNKLAPLFGDVVTLQAVLGAYRVHGSNAWATESEQFRVEPILNSLAFDDVLHAAFTREAARRGLQVGDVAKTPTIKILECRLLAKRFAPQTELTPPEGSLALIFQGLRSAFATPNTSAMGRIVWVGWFVCIATLPRAWVRRLYSRTRAQTGRSRFSRVLLGLSRGPARG